MNLGDFFFELLNWFFTLISDKLPFDLFNVNQTLSNFLTNIKSGLINLFSILSVFFDLTLFFILILIILTLPMSFVIIKGISRAIKRFL
jgi:hypothetical protein